MLYLKPNKQNLPLKGMLKKLHFPDTLIIIMGIMLIFTLLTWLIPAGNFEREIFEGRKVIVPGTFQYLDVQHGQGLMDFLRAPIKGMAAVADIIGFVLIVGGVFSLISYTGAFEAFLIRVIEKLKYKPEMKHWFIPVIMTCFSIGGATFGMSEEVLVFILLMIPMARSMGYDSIVGVAIPFLGAGAGFAGAFVNPFTIGIAQGIAGLPPGSGMGYRLVCWFAFTALAIWYVMRYARKIEKFPALSVVHEIDKSRLQEEVSMKQEQHQWNSSKRNTLFLLASAMILLLFGVNYWDWYIEEIAALFFGLGVIVAVLSKIPMNEAAKAFTNGTKDMVNAAMVIGFSRGLLVLVEEGKIIDTMLFHLASLAEGLPKVASVEIMFLFQSALNFFVPSGSGQAALTMPLMAPLSDLMGISRQVAVLAYQFGDGITNLIIPTSGITMGILEIAKIPYPTWFSWSVRFVIYISLLAMLLLIIPVLFMTW
jgi:uncharacterized ion transporter superfamily protein YfcC